jgi:HAD superfamily hydrolase (TIGR01509 family)
LPNRRLLADQLARAGIEIDPDLVPRAQYRAVRALDRAHAEGLAGAYMTALCTALGVPEPSLERATATLYELEDRRRSGRVLWSEPTPGAVEVINALRRAGIAVVIVTNSDGHAAENLGDAGILAATGLTAADVIDSVVVASAKPDPGIFEAALERAGVGAKDVVHVGDMLTTDVAGAERVGITPIHLDPNRACRCHGHRHVRSLKGIWAHIVRPDRL